MQQRPARGEHPLARLNCWPHPLSSPAQQTLTCASSTGPAWQSEIQTHFPLSGKLLPQGWRKSCLLLSSRCSQPKPRGFVPHQPGKCFPCKPRAPEETRGRRERLVHSGEAQAVRPKLPGRTSCRCSIPRTRAFPEVRATVPVPAGWRCCPTPWGCPCLHHAAGAVPAFPRHGKLCQPTLLGLTAGGRSGAQHAAGSPVSHGD